MFTWQALFFFLNSWLFNAVYFPFFQLFRVGNYYSRNKKRNKNNSPWMLLLWSLWITILITWKSMAMFKWKKQTLEFIARERWHVCTCVWGCAWYGHPGERTLPVTGEPGNDLITETVFKQLMECYLISGSYIPFKKYLLLFCVFNVYACLHVCVPRVCLVPAEGRSGHRSPGTRVTEGCKPVCNCSELNLGPLTKATSALSHGAISPDP